MKNVFLAFLFLCTSTTVFGQDIEGYWVGILTSSGERFKFEINIMEGDPKAPTILNCRRCKQLKGEIIDHRENEKIIDFLGIVHRDESINLVDKKFIFKETYEGEIRTKYQITVEMKGGKTWLVGYYQDYNSKGRKVKQGKIYLKREKEVESKA